MSNKKFNIAIPDLHKELCKLLLQIPKRKVTTYGDLARAMGSVSASRWVALHMNESIDPDDYPTFRVIKNTGDLGTYWEGRIDLKQELILDDRIKIRNGRINIEQYLFDEFKSNQPLNKLIKQQNHIQNKIEIKPFDSIPKKIGAVDVSYGDKDKSFATYAVVDTATQELVWSKTVSQPTLFPYIPGLLAYRELPVYLKLINKVRNEGQLAPVTLVDGNGIIHQQKAGIACQLGVYAGMKTIGVAKSLLCGTVTDQKMNEANIIEYKKEHIGVAVLPKGSEKPLYVSPGNGIDLKSSLAIVKNVMSRHRLPEPIYHADRISRIEAKKSSVS